jgi:molybdopterin converting factor small subunit
MQVRVNHFATLKREADHRSETVELPPGATVDDLLVTLGVTRDDVGVLIVSGKQATFDQALEAADTVTLIPHIGGG